MIQKVFAERVTEVLRADKSVIGLAVAGSWLTNEIDEFSDLDLILVTAEKITTSKDSMLAYANRFGELLSAFTGEHVGEPRLLICLYANPLLHVDIKFLTIDEFSFRIEDPTILLDKDNQLQKVIEQTEAKFSYPDYQWIEDRFWIWVHYILLKIGRGEYFEALDSLSYLRMIVLGPLLHIKNGNLPRGVRKVETLLQNQDLEQLKRTIGDHNKESLIQALEYVIKLYQKSRTELFNSTITLQEKAEKRVLVYLDEIKIKK